MSSSAAPSARVDPSRPMRDVNGHLIGIGDRVRTVWDTDMGVVIGTGVICAEDPPAVRTERPGRLGTFLTEPEYLVRVDTRDERAGHDGTTP